jgi:hypothetical protein
MSREQITAGNNRIDANEQFLDGYDNGSLYYYDRNHQVSSPVSSEVLRDFLTKNLHDPRETDDWNAGFVVGWMKAFFEHHLQDFYSSISLDEYVGRTESLSVVSLQEA